MATIELNDDELGLLFEALAALRERKTEALATSANHNMPFSARDFGIPQIDVLAVRLTAAYDGNED